MLRGKGGPFNSNFDQIRQIERLEVPENLKSKFQKRISNCLEFRFSKHIFMHYLTISLFFSPIYRSEKVFKKFAFLKILLRKHKSISKTIISLNSSHSFLYIKIQKVHIIFQKRVGSDLKKNLGLPCRNTSGYLL